MTWLDVLFAHWRVPPERLRPHVPAPLVLEEWDGSAWLGLTPFALRGLRLRGLPPLPVVSSFLKLNCRTYVRGDDRPGIWFFSLDASSPLAVEAARRTYRLPYRHARMSLDGRRYRSRRFAGDALFEATYEPSGQAAEPRTGTLEHFLTERYCLYADDGRARADIHHPPWSLQQAQGEIVQHGLSPVPLEGEPLLHRAARQDVVVWPLAPA